MAHEINTSVETLRAALGLVLTAILKQRAEREPQPTPFALTHFTTPVNLPTRRAVRIALLLRDVIEGALLIALREIGEELFAVGGLDLMSEVLESVAAEDPATYGRRANVADKRWDGIGDSREIWVA